VFLFFGTFLVPLTFFIVVQLVEPFLSQSIKVDLAMYWMKFFFGFPSMVAEELFFRGYGIGIMKRNGFNTWFSLSVSILMFSIFHVRSFDFIIVQMLPRIISGLIFSLLLIKYKNISIPFVAHIVWNLISTVGLSIIF
jgi:membrane protease YdiL (CAAX protease family)